MAAFVKAHVAKIVAALTALHAVLQWLGHSPIVGMWGANAGHYVTGALSIVTFLLAFFSPGRGVSIDTLLTALAGVQAANDPGSKDDTPKKGSPPSAWLLLPLVAILPLFSGCASLRAVLDTPSVEQALVEDGVELLVTGILDVLPVGTQGADAEALVTGCSAVDSVAGGMTGTAMTAQATLATALSMAKLSALQQQLLTQVDAGLNALVGNIASSNASVAAVNVSITNVCSWIVTAASPLIGDGK